MAKLIQMDRYSFGDLVEWSDKPALIHFSAPWNPLCNEVNETLESLAQEYGDRITIATVDIDENIDMAREHNAITSPTVLYFRYGDLERKELGPRPRFIFKRNIEFLLEW